MLEKYKKCQTNLGLLTVDVFAEGSTVVHCIKPVVIALTASI